MTWVDHVITFFTVVFGVIVSMYILGVLDRARRMILAKEVIDELQQEIQNEKAFIDIVSKYEEEDGREYK
jgi:hypothetical protein